jgi:N-acetyl-S-(2-succino)cysteine monooxygenase
MDMRPYPMDGPVPTHPRPSTSRSRAALLMDVAWRDKLTLRQPYYRVAAARGHLLLVGTPVRIADVMERWFKAGAANGFNVMPPFFLGQFDAFADRVVPISQERGLFRTDYAGKALRDHLGLRRTWQGVGDR